MNEVKIDSTGGDRAGEVLSRASFNNILRKYGIFFIFLGMVVIASILSPAFLTKINLINIVRQMSIIGLIALGVTGVIVTAGIDLSSGSVVGVSCVVAASFAQIPGGTRVLYPQFAGNPLYFSIIAGCLVGVVAGFINGFLVSKTKIPPFIATLGMFSAARGTAML